MNAETIRRQASAAQGDLGWVEAVADQLEHRIKSDSSGGISARRYDTVNRGGSDLTGPERIMEHALARQKAGFAGDAIDGQITTFLEKFKQASKAAHDTRKAAETFFEKFKEASRAAHECRVLAGKVITSQEERDLAAASGVASAEHSAGRGHCKICPDFCEGIKADRLVAGRCPTCLKFWDRHHREADRTVEMWTEAKTA